MGIGPYLGQQEKYVVLVFTRVSDHGRYSNRHLGQVYRWPKRHNLGWSHGLLFATSTGFEGRLDNDTSLHCHVVYNVVHNLCDGYRHFHHQVPVWFKFGLAQWYLQRIDPRFQNYDRPPDGEPDVRTDCDWWPKVFAWVRHGACRPLRELMTWGDYGPFRFRDYVCSWSRVAFLMDRHGDEGLRVYLHLVKAPLAPADETPPWELVLRQQDRAIAEGYGYDSPEALDAAWQEWVRKQGPKGPRVPSTRTARR
jgi:hypothetical protein